MGQIDPKNGWGPEDVIGGECTVVLEVAEDAQGVEKNKVAKVKPLKKDEYKSQASTDSYEGDFQAVPF